MFDFRLWLLVVTLFPTASLAEGYRAKPTIVVGEVGLHCPYEVSRSEPAPETEIGAIDVITGEPHVIALTMTVPAIADLGFGVQLKLAPDTELPGAEIVVHHPPMGPNGVTEQRWIPNLTDQSFNLSMYRFDFPYELLVGTWTIALEQGGTTHFYAEFDVVPAPSGLTLDALCSGEAFVS